MTAGRTLHFNSCIDWLENAWILPGESDGPQRLFDLRHIAERALLAESGLMNAVFMADFYTYRPGFVLEPVTLLSALAASTTTIGVIGSISTTYNEPYTLARMLASLDHLSAGRAGWNMVTTANTPVAANYSRTEHLEHDLRYARAHEFVEVVTGLWDSWSDDALRYDKASGRYLDPAGVRPLNYKGEWFSVAGPLNVPRPPQGHPLRMQAGSSQAGRDFAARWAEVIFTAQPLLPIAKDFYSDINKRAEAFGRTGAIRILPGLMPFVAPTRAEAQAAVDERTERRGKGEARLKEFIGIEIADLPEDEPIPLELLPERGTNNGMRGRSDLMLEIIRRYRLTPRQVREQEAHHAFAGTPRDTADLICQWFEERGCDGFTLMWPSPQANALFVSEVVPILQSRGVYRTAYEGRTLRDHFRLARPEGASLSPADSAK